MPAKRKPEGKIEVIATDSLSQYSKRQRIHAESAALEHVDSGSVVASQTTVSEGKKSDAVQWPAETIRDGSMRFYSLLYMYSTPIFQDDVKKLADEVQSIEETGFPLDCTLKANYPNHRLAVPLWLTRWIQYAYSYTPILPAGLGRRIFNLIRKGNADMRLNTPLRAKKIELERVGVVEFMECVMELQPSLSMRKHALATFVARSKNHKHEDAPKRIVAILTESLSTTDLIIRDGVGSRSLLSYLYEFGFSASYRSILDREDFNPAVLEPIGTELEPCIAELGRFRLSMRAQLGLPNNFYSARAIYANMIECDDATEKRVEGYLEAVRLVLNEVAGETIVKELAHLVTGYVAKASAAWVYPAGQSV